MGDEYDSYFDYDNDGEHDDYEQFMKEEDDDYFYHQTCGENTNSDSAYKASTNSSNANTGGLSLWKSFIIGLIACSGLFVLLGIDMDSVGAVVPIIIWVIIALVVFFATNNK